MAILETTYTIAPFNPEIDDPAEIADMHRVVREWEVENGKNTFTDILDSQVDLRAIPDYYLASGGAFFVARAVDQQKVGFVGLRNENAGIGQLKRLAVLPEHHRRGIGSMLVGANIAWAKANDFMLMTLQTGELDAKALYEKFGFKEIGRLLKNRDYLMELPLSD